MNIEWAYSTCSAGRYDEARTVTQAALASGTPYEKYLLSVIANADLGQGNLDSSLLRYEALIRNIRNIMTDTRVWAPLKLVPAQIEESIQYLNELRNARERSTFIAT